MASGRRRRTPRFAIFDDSQACVWLFAWGATVLWVGREAQEHRSEMSSIPERYREVIEAPSLVHIVQRHAQQAPHGVVFQYLRDDGSLEIELTYAQLDYAAKSVAVMLLEVLRLL